LVGGLGRSPFKEPSSNNWQLAGAFTRVLNIPQIRNREKTSKEFICWPQRVEIAPLKVGIQTNSFNRRIKPCRISFFNSNLKGLGKDLHRGVQ